MFRQPGASAASSTNNDSTADALTNVMFHYTKLFSAVAALQEANAETEGAEFPLQGDVSRVGELSENEEDIALQSVQANITNIEGQLAQLKKVQRKSALTAMQDQNWSDETQGYLNQALLQDTEQIFLALKVFAGFQEQVTAFGVEFETSMKKSNDFTQRQLQQIRQNHLHKANNWQQKLLKQQSASDKLQSMRIGMQILHTESTFLLHILRIFTQHTKTAFIKLNSFRLAKLTTYSPSINGDLAATLIELAPYWHIVANIEKEVLNRKLLLQENTEIENLCKKQHIEMFNKLLSFLQRTRASIEPFIGIYLHRYHQLKAYFPAFKADWDTSQILGFEKINRAYQKLFKGFLIYDNLKLLKLEALTSHLKNAQLIEKNSPFFGLNDSFKELILSLVQNAVQFMAPAKLLEESKSSWEDFVTFAQLEVRLKYTMSYLEKMISAILRSGQDLSSIKQLDIKAVVKELNSASEDEASFEEVKAQERKWAKEQEQAKRTQVQKEQQELLFLQNAQRLAQEKAAAAESEKAHFRESVLQAFESLSSKKQRLCLALFKTENYQDFKEEQIENLLKDLKLDNHPTKSGHIFKIHEETVSYHNPHAKRQETLAPDFIKKLLALFKELNIEPESLEERLSCAFLKKSHLKD